MGYRLMETIAKSIPVLELCRGRVKCCLSTLEKPGDPLKYYVTLYMNGTCFATGHSAEGWEEAHDVAIEQYEAKGKQLRRVAVEALLLILQEDE